MDGGPTPSCSSLLLDDPVVRATAFVSASDPVALATRDDGSLTAWVGLVDGQRRLSVLRLGTDGAPSVSGVADAASNQRDPMVAATRSGYLVVWRDDRDGDMELLARSVDPAGIAGDSTFVLTDTGEEEGRAALGLTGAGTPVVAWADPNAEAAGHVMPLAEDGTPGADVRVPEMAGLLGAPVLAQLGTGAALAWVDAATLGVRVQRLGDAGEPLGEVTAIAAEGNARGGLDLARSSDGSVLLFDVNVAGSDPQIRYQSFDEDAAAVGPERVLNPSSRAGAAGSLTELASGFAAVYLSQADGAAEPSLHLALFEAGTDAELSMDLSPVAQLGGTRPLVRSSPDGRRLTVAWSDDGRVLTLLARCE